jgi:hypothetical protein
MYLEHIRSTEQHDEQKQALAKDVLAEHDEQTNRCIAWYRSFADEGEDVVHDSGGEIWLKWTTQRR